MPQPRAMRRLSLRERQCLEFAALGMTSEDIAIKLGIAARTANFHIANVLHKLDALNRREAVAIALSAGFITAASSRTVGPSNGEYIAS